MVHIFKYCYITTFHIIDKPVNPLTFYPELRAYLGAIAKFPYPNSYTKLHGWNMSVKLHYIKSNIYRTINFYIHLM